MVLGSHSAEGEPTTGCRGIEKSWLRGKHDQGRTQAGGPKARPTARIPLDRVCRLYPNSIVPRAASGGLSMRSQRWHGVLEFRPTIARPGFVERDWICHFETPGWDL